MSPEQYQHLVQMIESLGNRLNLIVAVQFLMLGTFLGIVISWIYLKLKGGKDGE